MARIYIIDTKLLMYTEFHRGQPTSDMFQALALELNNVGKGKIYFAYDAPEGSKRRKSIFPEYKANRNDRELKMSKIEKRQFKEFKLEYLRYKDVLSRFGNVLYLAGWEADDFANLICQQFAGKDVEVVMVTSDRDWSANMVAPNIKIFHWGRKVMVTTQEHVKEVFGLETKDCIEAQVFAGISKENVEGIKNFGPSRYLSTVDTTLPKAQKLAAVQAILDVRVTKSQIENGTGKWGTKLPDKFNSLEEMYDFNMSILRPVTMNDLNENEQGSFKRQFTAKAPVSSVHGVIGAFAQLNQVFMPCFNIINFFNLALPEQT